MDRHAREQWLAERAFHNVDAIVGTAEQQDRPTIQRCCALTLNESDGGLNIYSQSEGPADLRGQVVTKENFEGVYLPWHNKTGGLTGIGLGQLTSFGYVQAAIRLGGPWNAYCTAQVAFRVLHELIERYGVFGGAAAYNGGPGWADSPGRAQAERYALEFISHERALIAEGLR